MAAAVRFSRFVRSVGLLASPLLAGSIIVACNSTPVLPADTVPPQLTVIAPSSGMVLGRNGTATFTGSASDDREVAAVKLLDGVTSEELALAVLSTRDDDDGLDRREWTITWQPDGDGERLLSLIAVDGAGNEAKLDVPVVVADLWFRDVDGDGFGDPDATVGALEEPPGYVATTGDCDDENGAINPEAADDPDLGFVDQNCDGIDGDILASFFVSPLGDDSNPGTPEAPFATPAIAIFSSPIGSGMKKIIVAEGTYPADEGLKLSDGLEIYGGYDPNNWSRSEANVSKLTGTVQGVLADGDVDVVLQLLHIEAGPGEGSLSVYGVRAIDGSDIRLERVTVVAGDAIAGVAGSPGTEGEEGEWGYDGDDGLDSSIDTLTFGGWGAYSPVGMDGGDGGYGWDGGDGDRGWEGEGPGGGAGGAGGASSSTCAKGEDGADGLPGRPGTSGMEGLGGLDVLSQASTEWQGDHGKPGEAGTHGSGGGGGGAGGGHGNGDTCQFTGSAGGGGGAGGEAGGGGKGGMAGGGSFGIYIWNSTVTVSHGSSITTGHGGAGGDGGAGGPGGSGGEGGYGGYSAATSIGGNGGSGGDGGAGGAGGGAAGGPSIGIFVGGPERLLLHDGDTSFTIGTPGEGGSSARHQGEDGVSAEIAYP